MIAEHSANVLDVTSAAWVNSIPVLLAAMPWDWPAAMRSDKLLKAIRVLLQIEIFS